jgi:hypothetical protein
MLLTRRQAGDIGRARVAATHARATARELGLDHMERQAVEILRLQSETPEE